MDEVRNRTYVAEWTTRVTVIDGATNTTSAVANPEYNTHKNIVNPGANEFYTLNMTTNVYNKNAASSVGFLWGLSRENHLGDWHQEHSALQIQRKAQILQVRPKGQLPPLSGRSVILTCTEHNK